jgi:hypothetical protein
MPVVEDGAAKEVQLAKSTGIVIAFAIALMSAGSAFGHQVNKCNPDPFAKLEGWQKQQAMKIAREVVDAGVAFFGKQTTSAFKALCEKKGGEYHAEEYHSSRHHCSLPSGMSVTSYILLGDRYQYTVVYPNYRADVHTAAVKRLLAKRYGPPTFKFHQADDRTSRSMYESKPNKTVWQWSDTEKREFPPPFNIRVGFNGLEVAKHWAALGGTGCPFSIEQVYECL